MKHIIIDKSIRLRGHSKFLFLISAVIFFFTLN